MAVNKIRGLWHLPLLKLNQKIETINKSWSQKTSQIIPLHEKAELALIYIYISHILHIHSFSKYSQTVLFHLLLLTHKLGWVDLILILQLKNLSCA